MRDTLTTLGEIIGAAAITAGAALFSLAAGLVVGGMFLIAGSWLSAVRRR